MALLYFGTEQPEVGLNTPFEVGVFVDTQGQAVNVVSGTVVLPDSLTVNSILDGQSAAALWVDRPQVTADGVSFSGVLPGGYNGSRLYLFSLVVSAKTEGSSVVNLEHGQAFLNDGLGTEISLNVAPLKLQALDSAEVSPLLLPTDTEAPEPFTPVLAHDPNLFQDQWFVSFATQDKISGIAYYEVQEHSGLFATKWQKAESPYVLQDQDDLDVVHVRAVDQAGNERTEKVLSAERSVTAQYGILGIILLGLVLAGVCVLTILKLWRKRKDIG